MIASFGHKGLQRLFDRGDLRGINAQIAPKLRRQLALLDVSNAPGDMDLPGFRLHQLSGDRKGQWAVWVTGNWRLVFAFDGMEAIDVDLVDYN